MQSHPLDGDGISAELFKFLLKVTNAAPVGTIHFRVPETILYYNGCASFWYFYDETCSSLRKRPAKDLDKPTIFKVFSQQPRSARSNIVAQFASSSSSSMDLLYFTKETLRKFLFSSTKDERFKDGILQKFVEPKGDRNEVYQVIWSPTLSFAVKRYSHRKLYEKMVSPLERCATFDGPTHLAEEFHCNIYTIETFKSLCESFVSYFGSTDTSTAIGRMVAYFKIDVHNTKWLLFTSSVRIVERGDLVLLTQQPPPSPLGILDSSTPAATIAGGDQPLLPHNVSTVAHHTSTLSPGANTSATSTARISPHRPRRTLVTPLTLALTSEGKKARGSKKERKKVFTPTPQRLLAPLRTCATPGADDIPPDHAEILRRRFEKIEAQKEKIRRENAVLDEDLDRLKKAAAVIWYNAESSVSRKRSPSPTSTRNLSRPQSAASLRGDFSQLMSNSGDVTRPATTSPITPLDDESSPIPVSHQHLPHNLSLAMDHRRSFRDLIPAQSRHSSEVMVRCSSTVSRRSVGSSKGVSSFIPTEQMKIVADMIRSSAHLYAETLYGEYLEVSMEMSDLFYHVEQRLLAWKRGQPKVGAPQSIPMEEAVRTKVPTKYVKFCREHLGQYFEDLHATLVPCERQQHRIFSRDGMRVALGTVAKKSTETDEHTDTTDGEQHHRSEDGSAAAGHHHLDDGDAELAEPKKESTCTPVAPSEPEDNWGLSISQMVDSDMTMLVFCHPLATLSRSKIFATQLQVAAESAANCFRRSAQEAANRVATQQHQQLLEGVRSYTHETEPISSELGSPTGRQVMRSHAELLAQLKKNQPKKRPGSSFSSPLSSAPPGSRAAMIAQIRQQERKRTDPSECDQSRRALSSSPTHSDSETNIHAGGTGSDAAGQPAVAICSNESFTSNTGPSSPVAHIAFPPMDGISMVTSCVQEGETHSPEPTLKEEEESPSAPVPFQTTQKAPRDSSLASGTPPRHPATSGGAQIHATAGGDTDMSTMQPPPEESTCTGTCTSSEEHDFTVSADEEQEEEDFALSQTNDDEESAPAVPPPDSEAHQERTASPNFLGTSPATKVDDEEPPWL